MGMGEMIRKFRRSCDMTQEQFAEYLHISAQAVSRWETGQAMPDITLLPAIANLFEVSIDDLFGMDEIRDREYRDGIFQSAHALIADKRYDEAVEVYRDALKTFPKDYGIMSDLALALSLDDFATEEGKDKAREAIALCERVLANSTSDKLRATTRAALCYLYYALDNHPKAVDECRKLPHFWESREMLMPEYMERKEAEAYLKDVIGNVLSLLCDKIDIVTTEKGGTRDILAIGPSLSPKDDKAMESNVSKVIGFMNSGGGFH